MDCLVVTTIPLSQSEIRILSHAWYSTYYLGQSNTSFNILLRYCSPSTNTYQNASGCSKALLASVVLPIPPIKMMVMTTCRLEGSRNSRSRIWSKASPNPTTVFFSKIRGVEEEADVSLFAKSMAAITLCRSGRKRDVVSAVRVDRARTSSTIWASITASAARAAHVIRLCRRWDLP